MIVLETQTEPTTSTPAFIFICVGPVVRPIRKSPQATALARRRGPDVIFRFRLRTRVCINLQSQVSAILN